MYYLVFVKATRVLRNISLLNFSMRKRPLQCLSDLRKVSLCTLFFLQLYEHSKYLKLQIFDVWFTAPTSNSTQASRTWLWRRIHRKLWSLVFWHSNCQRKTKCKVRLIKQVTSFVGGASITHRKERGYIFQERVGCEQKPNNTYGYMAMIKLVYS